MFKIIVRFQDLSIMWVTLVTGLCCLNLKKEQELLGRLIAAIIPIGHSLIYETSVLYTILFSYKKKNHTFLLLEKKINYKTNL